MRFWFLTARLATERAAVASLAETADWFTLQRWAFVDWLLCVEGIIRVRGAEYPVRLCYPDQFPQVPAWVVPQDPAAKWSTHQYGAGGTLCLELRPDTWNQAATGADVLMSAFHLLDIENPLGQEDRQRPAPSAHNVGAIQAYDWGSDPLFISDGCMERIRAGAASDVQGGHSRFLNKLFPVFVHDAIDRNGPQFPPTAEGPLSQMPAFVSRESPPSKTPSSRIELRSMARLPEHEDARLAPPEFAIVLFDDGKELTGFLAMNDEAPQRLHTISVPETCGQRSGRLANKKRVAIVGCGSVGSKVAECVLRSGVHELTLVDGDVMLPANLERHSLDWRDVGYRKVNGLKRRLRSIVPGAQVRELASNLNWQRSARTHASQIDAIAACDVIVDATGDVPTSLLLGAVAAENKRSFVSIEVFEGGIGALIASCVPGRDPGYAKARAGFLDWCTRQDVPPPKTTGRPYEALSEDGNPMIADDAAVTIAAAHGARVVLDIVDGTPAPREAAWMLVGFQAAWVFDGHGATIRMSVGTADDEEPAHVEGEALAFIMALLKQQKEVHPGSAWVGSCA